MVLILFYTRTGQDYFSKWGDSGEVDLKYELEHLIILTASRCLLGREVRDKLFDDVSALFHDLDNGMLPISVLFPYLPIPAHRRRDRARKKLAEIFANIIALTQSTKMAARQRRPRSLACLLPLYLLGSTPVPSPPLGLGLISFVTRSTYLLCWRSRKT